MSYVDPNVGEWEDDGTMPDSVEDLANAVIGHRIVSAEQEAGSYYGEFVLTLDNGTRVRMTGTGDCCAYTELDSFLLNPNSVDHIITGVCTENEYNTWHIFADMGDVLKLDVSWSAGNPFYYGYGFHIQVEEL